MLMEETECRSKGEHNATGGRKRGLKFVLLLYHKCNKVIMMFEEMRKNKSYLVFSNVVPIVHSSIINSSVVDSQ